MNRSETVDQKQWRLALGVDAARLSGVLATEAQVRAARVLERWVGRIDRETGLLPKGTAANDQVWDYADAAADLYPHLLIGAALLEPNHYSPLLSVLTRERANTGPGQLPATVNLGSGRREEQEDFDDRMYGAVEYGKDGLLPLTERLGPGPWLERLRELAQAIDRASTVPTHAGPIPSEESEVNGQALQIFSRLYWATGDELYFKSAERIARAYLERVLPKSGWVPARTWDFRRGRRNTDEAQLRDHGNEVVAGLVEFHLIETARGLSAGDHRTGIRAMLDRLLEVGRTADGMWKSTINIDTGKPLKDTLSDNWGYLYAAYLTQAQVEETWPGGDAEAARRYRTAAQVGVAAAIRLDLYPWQGSEQDGYADTIESALYLLQHVREPAAAGWVDRQAGTLFGTQAESGRVEDRYLDGNFVRTALLYAAWQTHGVRLDPWRPDAMLGAASEGACLSVATAAGRDWRGRLILDTPRHRLHLGLPLNYPRLNEWPEWFVADPSRRYSVDDSGGDASGSYDGAALAEGIALQLPAGAERWLRICPTTD